MTTICHQHGLRMLIIEDDVAFSRTLARSFVKRGYQVEVINDATALGPMLERQAFDLAVVDLKLGHASGLNCVDLLHRRDPGMRIVVLTGYASIATAVEAIKLGATHYLPKPASTEEIEAAFGLSDGTPDTPVATTRPSIKKLEWERIQLTLAETGFNISEAARRLGMHRRTLVRKLQKRAPN